jgi:PhzF family phenazine biosynthesis protein
MKFWYVNAFTKNQFQGNPACVFLGDHFPENMQEIAAELNVSETTFVKRLGGNHFHIRWFSPKDEAPLCGHATLAATHILYTNQYLNTASVSFTSLAGPLTVHVENDLYTLDFPKKAITPAKIYDPISNALGNPDIQSIYQDDLIYIALLKDPLAVRDLTPSLELIEKIDCRAVAVTAPGFGQYDFVSRYFAPRVGIPEDPVCGSLHCRIAPFWAERLKKEKMLAYQFSKRTGELSLTYLGGERVLIGGHAVTVASSHLKPLQISA